MVNLKVLSDSQKSDHHEAEDFLYLLHASSDPFLVTDLMGFTLTANNAFKSDPEFQSKEFLLTLKSVCENLTASTASANQQVIDFSKTIQVRCKSITVFSRPALLFQFTKSIQHKAEVKLKAFKSIYHGFVNNTFELILRTNVNGKIIFCNKLFAFDLGFNSVKEAKQNAFYFLFQDSEVYETIKSKVLNSNKVQRELVYLTRKDNTTLTGLLNCQVFESEEGIPTLNWTILNISAQTEFEARLKEKNVLLEKVNNQMEKFLYSASHDLRSPLTTILGLVNLMRMEVKDKNALDYATKIEISATKLDKIIKDIMGYSRTTYQRVKSEKINFEQLIWKVFSAYNSIEANKRIRTEIRVNGDFQYYTDPERIEIVLDNLIRNAYQFADVNKTVSFIQIEVVVDSIQAKIKVIDNGVGIGTQHLDNIFNMFYKASHLSKGAGLGLYIAKEAIQQLSGSIVVESEVGFGTVFQVILPNDHKGKLINRKLLLSGDMFQ